MDNISRPSHRSFLALHAILWSILGLLAYFLLNLPFYIYFILGLFFLIYKNTENVSSAVFIRESKNINVCVVGSGFRNVIFYPAHLPVREVSIKLAGYFSFNDANKIVCALIN